MSFDLSKLMTMGGKAAGVFGMKDVAGMAGKAMKLYSAYQKYPKTMQGLEQAINDMVKDPEAAKHAMSALSPEQRGFIEQEMPGSLKLIEEKIAGKTGAAPATPPGTTPIDGNERIRALLERSKPLR